MTVTRTLWFVPSVNACAYALPRVLELQWSENLCRHTAISYKVCVGVSSKSHIVPRENYFLLALLLQPSTPHALTSAPAYAALWRQMVLASMLRCRWILLCDTQAFDATAVMCHIMDTLHKELHPEPHTEPFTAGMCTCTCVYQTGSL